MILIKTTKPELESISFDKTTGLGEIIVSGELKVLQGIDDPVIEIFNAVQLKMQTAILDTQGKELINFTPFFPSYDKKKNVTIYKLAPTKPAGIPAKKFLEAASKTLDIFYKNLFVASFCQFLDDENEVCNYNGYSLYRECIQRIEKEEDSNKREYDIRTVRILLEYFIGFLGLPLPRSKEAFERKGAQLTRKLLEASEKDWESQSSFNPKRVRELLA